MRIANDSEILKLETRQQFLQSVIGSLNYARKNFMKRRYNVFKDGTKKYVLENFEKESSNANILEEIKNRASNISFCRKIIDKKCTVYKDGAARELQIPDEKLQSSLDQLECLLNFNSVMKKTNKYEELFKNALVQVVPYQCNEGWELKMGVWPAFMYDVIEDANFPERAKVIVFSYWNPQRSSSSYAAPNMSGFREKTGALNAVEDLNQLLSDLEFLPTEEMQYVWWSDNYHFTTDHIGQIIPGMQEDNLSNPIGELPFIDFSRDKDGQFWVAGGEDIIEGSILLNTLLTDLYFISKFQGMGVGYMFGKGVPKNLKIGPSSFVSLEVEQGDPTPQFGFANSNPPIDAHLKMIEGHLAYLLSSNNLETGTIAGSLSTSSAQSGLQEIIRRAENLDDVEDQQSMYKDNEPSIFRIAFKWLNLYFDKGLLSPAFQAIGKIPDDTKVNTRFLKPVTYMTENDRLAAIQLRLDMGISSKIDAIMDDNPDLSLEQAKEMLDKINEENDANRNNGMIAIQNVAPKSGTNLTPKIEGNSVP